MGFLMFGIVSAAWRTFTKCGVLAKHDVVFSVPKFEVLWRLQERATPMDEKRDLLATHDLSHAGRCVFVIHPLQ